MIDAAAALRTLLRNQGCRTRGGRCNCMLLCRIDADEIVAEAGTEFRREVAEIMHLSSHVSGGEGET